MTRIQSLLAMALLMGCFHSPFLREARAQHAIEASQEAVEHEIHKVKFNELEAKLKEPADGLRVVNFWATWCRPCVQEMPHLEELNEKAENVEVWLVSVDDPGAEQKVKTFARKKELESKIFLVQNKDPNEWLTKIDPSWTGSIPSTLVVSSEGEYLKFQSGSFPNYDALKKFIAPYTQ